MKKFPHVYVILFLIIALSAVLTYIISPNQYDLAIGADGEPTKLIDPNTYHAVERTPVDPWQMMLSIPKGMAEAADIIFFLFIIAGAFAILQGTGAIEAGIKSAALKLKGLETALIFVLVVLFSFGGATFGMAEEALVFIPMLIPLAMALGYDSMTGVALALVGPCAGFTGAFMNPFTLAIAQGIVGLPIFSGMEYRVVIFVITTLVAFFFINAYAKKVKKNPELSVVYEVDKNREKLTLDDHKGLSGRQIAVLILLLLTFVLLIYGVNKWGWYIQEIAALFLSMGLIAGIIAGMNINKMADLFVDGAVSLTMGALVVGLARAVLVVLRSGSILHTIVHAMAAVVQGLPPALSAIGMYIVQLIISVLIPSGSGMATVTMPIMGPLATLLGMTQQTAVLIYQFADGFTNIIIPTSGFLLAALALGKIPYEKWVKWYTPLFLIMLALGGMFIIIAQIIAFGPF